MKKETIKNAITDSLPVMAGYIFLGMGFGIIMKTNGYPTILAILMSIFIYAGSMQYVAIGLLSGGASFLTVALTTLAVNARHLFYGLSMINPYKNTGFKKTYLIFALTDETYSLVCNKEPNAEYYFLVSLFNQIYWILGTLLGAALGATLSFNSKGIDFALTALFITVFVDQWMKEKNHFAAICGVILSIVCLLLFGRNNFLIPAMICIATCLLLKTHMQDLHDKKQSTSENVIPRMEDTNDN